MNLNDKKLAVIGLGIEGRDLVSYLTSMGADVTVLDAKDDLDWGDIDPKKVQKVTGETYLDSLENYDVVFRSPGVYPYQSAIQHAVENGVILSSAVKLFFDLCPAKIIGVTGTKGKGTTSTLIYEIMKHAGKDVYLAGNIGKPYLSLLPKLKKDSYVILELSSFQLIDLHKSPHISVVLNITTDHLDWHIDREEYINAKKSIVSFQSDKDFAIINHDYEDSKSFAELGDGVKHYFSTKEKVKGTYVKDNKFYYSDHKDTELFSTDVLTLRGSHNWENVAAAITASMLAGADLTDVKEVVPHFAGLEHRLEFVEEVDGVKFYNDSFGTGPETVIAALKSFDEPTSAILGGFEKGLDYTELAKYIADAKNISYVCLIGDIGERIGKDIKTAGYKGKIEYLGKPSMDEIVAACKDNAPEGGVVVLSPGTSSFDMFESYKERGNKFKESVKKLKKSASK